QDVLARQVGCAVVTIKKIEADSLRPSRQIAERLATALEVPPHERDDFMRLARATPQMVAPPAPPPIPPSSAKLDNRSGPSIKGYDLRERIGSGGFGAVYRAFQPVVAREVAIKIILPQYANHPEFIRRFEAEAHFIARLEHPHIVPLYDYWREPGGAYLVLRLLRRSVADALITGGPWSLARVSRLVEEGGGGLVSAHACDVTHGDVGASHVLFGGDRA